MLTQPRSLKAKCNNEFGIRNKANEIPVCGSKMHRLQQPEACFTTLAVIQQARRSRKVP